MACGEAVAQVRTQVWRRSGATTGTAPVVLDIDASLHQVHSENKELAAATYKGGYGFHSLYCFADATGETLGVLLRAGNAGANNIADHVTVLDQAIGQLPDEIAAGHRAGDDPALVARRVQVRTAISRAIGDTGGWAPAIRQDGEPREGAHVAELTDLADLTGWPTGTRLIVGREPLHPGAQQTLFPSLSFRYWGHYTDNPDGDAVTLDAHMRAHAHVEDHIGRLKDSGAQRFPFRDIDANRTWLTVVCFADALVRWFQQLCLTGPLARAEPKTLRWGLWHTPARIIGHARGRTVRILEGWPNTPSPNNPPDQTRNDRPRPSAITQPPRPVIS